MTDRGTYIKMSDSLPEHRKIVAAGGDAAWLHVCALAYASRNLTDGFIPAGVVPRLSDRKQAAKLAAKLADVELWHLPGHDCKRCPQPPAETYVIHDYLIHQRSAARVAEVSVKRAASGARGGSKSRPKAKQVASDLLDGCSDDAQANGKRSFAEGFTNVKPQAEGSLRDPQAEEPLRGSQAEAEVPPPAGAAKPPPPNPGPVVAAYVEGATEAGLPAPSASLKARVGRQARELIAERKPMNVLLDAARHMGAVGWNDLAVQVQRDAANAAGHAAPGESTGAQRAQAAIEAGRRVQAMIDGGNGQ